VARHLCGCRESAWQSRPVNIVFALTAPPGTVRFVSTPALAVWRGNIAGCAEVDAVVNAANEHLAQGSGVCGAIFRAAGAAQLTEACDAIGHCATGDAVATPGFGLSARWIIHTVGPRWIDGKHQQTELLASCYRRTLEVAEGLGPVRWRSRRSRRASSGFPPSSVLASRSRPFAEQ